MRGTLERETKQTDPGGENTVGELYIGGTTAVHISTSGPPVADFQWRVPQGAHCLRRRLQDCRLDGQSKSAMKALTQIQPQR
jgi:hypothetical protein